MKSLYKCNTALIQIIVVYAMGLIYIDEYNET